jgi:hypothetical protein
MALIIQNDLTHTRRRKPTEETYTNYIRVIECPMDQSLCIERFPRGSHFDRTSFGATLKEGYFPGGMIVEIYVKEYKKRITFKVYGAKTDETSPYLHQCDSEGFLIEDGLIMVAYNGGLVLLDD